jgi:predicted ATPase
MFAHDLLGETFLWTGEVGPAREHLEHIFSLYDSQKHSALLIGGFNLEVFCHALMSLALWQLGYPDQALQHSQDARSRARELAHPFSLAVALDYAAMLHQFRRDVPATQELAEATIALCREQGMTFYLAWGTALRGWALAVQGQGETGIAQIRQGLAAFRETGSIGLLWWLSAPLLAEAYGQDGQPGEGLHVVAEALEGSFYEAEQHRLKGELMLTQSSGQRLAPSVQKEAEDCFLKAIEIARRQQAKSWELRATMSLARLWRQQGKQAEAHKMLSEVYNWFTEGFDTKDLQEAKTLLEALA